MCTRVTAARAGFLQNDAAVLLQTSGARPLKVGIPRAMGFYDHGLVWARMFQRLHCEVVFSPPTNQEILDAGVRVTATEFCLPVKVLVGHVRALAGQVDVVFVPRYLSNAVDEMSCPKACALPDVVRYGMEKSVEILEASVDPDRFETEGEAIELEPIAQRLGVAEESVRTALAEARREPPFIRPKGLVSGRMIALLGHPYVLEDPCISMKLAEKLRAYGYGVIMPLDLPQAVRRADVHPYAGKAFYTIGLDVLGAAHALARQADVCGMIYLTSFGCGVDALAAAHVEQHMRNGRRRMPFMKLTVDEQTGEAGFDTRVEAFLDMIGG